MRLLMPWCLVGKSDDAIQSQLDQQIPPLKERARLPARLIAAVDSGETMDVAYRRLVSV